MEHILVGEQIIALAKIELGKKLSDGIYVTLTDHISSAIDRSREGIFLKNALLWDIRQFYPDEFHLGKKAVEIIREELGVELLEDEAAFIALHFVNAQLDENMTMVHDMTKLIQEITNIVKYHLHIEYSADSLAYFRFISHLKYFAQRMLKGESYDDDSSDLLGAIKAQQGEAYSGTLKVAEFIKQYDYSLTNDEILYMTVHIARILKEARRQKY